MSDAFARELAYTVDLNKDIKKTYLNTIFTADDCLAHRFIIEIKKDGSAVSFLNGVAVDAYFIRYSDNATIHIKGSTLVNTATVLLSNACYKKTGQFALVIKLTQGDTVNTIFYGEGSVYHSKTDIIVDEENIIPSLSDLLAQIDAMEKATAAAETAAQNASHASTSAETAALQANIAANAANNAAKSWGDSVAADSTKLGGTAADQYAKKPDLFNGARCSIGCAAAVSITTSYTSADNNRASASVTFPASAGFTAAPIVVASVNGATPDKFAVGVSNVTQTGCTITLAAIGATEAKTATVSYIAIQPRVALA